MSKLIVCNVCAALFLGSVSTTINAALPSPLGPSCQLSESTVWFYKDGPASGVSIYNDWGVSWSEVVGFDSGSDKEIAAKFLQPWGSIRLQGDVGHYPLDYDAISFTVRSWEDYHELYPYFVDVYGSPVSSAVSTSNYLIEGAIQAAERTVHIPTRDLIQNGGQQIAGLIIESNLAKTAYLDNVKLVPKTPGLITLYSDHLGVAIDSWNVNLSTTFTEPFGGDNAIEASFTAAWGGITLGSKQVYNNEEFGAVTMAVKGATGGQDLYVYLLDQNGDKIGSAKSVSTYLYGGAIPSDWQVAWIPLKDLTGPQTMAFGGIGIESTIPGTVWLDEVKVVEKLVWPLPEVAVGDVSGYRFGSDWEVTGSKCNGQWKWHVGVDYDNYQVAGKTVVAAHAGKVVGKYQDSDPDWGWHVVIQTLSKTFVTSYTHLNEPSVTLNQDVVQGETIGTTASIPSGPHLDFTVRFGEYDLFKSIRGAYPQTPCSGLDAFPEKFINPELIDWE